MLMPAIDNYLAIRRAAGFRLRVTEGLLRAYARFAAARGETHVRARTALDWAALAPSVSQRGRRFEAVTIFARHAQVEDAQHEVPPQGVFPRQRLPYRPFIFTAGQIRQLLERAARLPPRRLIAAVDLLHAILLVGGHGAAYLGGAGAALRGYHCGRSTDSYDQVPQKPPSAAASERARRA